MRPACPVRRAIVVVLDGLRPDAIDAFDLQHVAQLRALGASTLTATTVSPSLTWAAMTSLMTGVSPQLHGVVSDTVHLPRPRVRLEPLPAALEAAGLPSTAVLGAIPSIYRGVASRIGRKLGICDLRFVGRRASEILQGAGEPLRTQRRGLVFLHWPDADGAGHDHGWMSREYEEGARRLDGALGSLLALLDLESNPETLLIALADHGGGGVDPKDHESTHPLDRTVPILMAGAGVAPGTDLGPDVSLLDVPATVLWALGLERPSSYVGRALTEAFESRPSPAIAVA